MIQNKNGSFSVPSIAVIIFFVTLFISIFFTAPALQINDEWITMNQLSQLSHGHQIIFSEGKYGTFINKEITPYLELRENILGYSLALPIISLPINSLFTIAGDLLRFLIICFWIIIPVLILISIRFISPNTAIIKKPWFFIIISMLSLFLLYINLRFYYPFIVTTIDSPLEVASVIFTDQILFSLLAVIIFYIACELFSDIKTSLLGTIATLCCSSYLYWASSAKDHMISIVIFSLCLLFFLKYEDTFKKYFSILSFFFAGLLVWVRPELGFTTCVILTLFFYTQYIYAYFKHKSPFLRKNERISLLIPVMSLIGGIPFFINNYIISGNPLYPIYLRYEMNLISSVSQNTTNSGVSNITSQGLSSTAGDGIYGISSIITLLQRYYSINTSTILSGFKGILFVPENGGFSIAAVCPFFLIGIILLIIIYIWKRQVFSPKDTKKITILILFILIMFIAYIKYIPTLHISEGIGPDIRYLSPLYVPANLLGFYCLYKIKALYTCSTMLKSSIACLIIIPPTLIIGLLTLQPFGGGYYVFNELLSIISYILSGILLISCIIQIAGYNTRWLNSIIFPILISTPMAWQIMLVFLFSLSKYNGYSFWLPITEQIFNTFFIPIS